MSQVDLVKAATVESKPLPVAWTQRDLLLYAVSVGCKKDQLKFLYEKHPSFTPFPTYPLVLGFKGATTTINDFATMISSGGINPHLPKIDPNRILHGEQSIEVLKVIPKESGKGWQLKRRTTGAFDKGSGLLIEYENVLVDPKGEAYVKMNTSSFIVGAGGIGGPQQPKMPLPTPPKDRRPDFIGIGKTSEEQAVLYRLSGDYNPLHIDPAIGKRSGFEGPILHGLCSYGHAATVIVSDILQDDASRFVSMTGRFASPVYPGATLETLVWISPEPLESDRTEILFVQRVKETSKICISNGRAVVKGKITAGAKSKL